MSLAAMPNDTALWARYLAARDAATREEIILRYVPLVRYSLGRLGIEPGPEYDDLVGQGLLGLIEAVDRFDPARGASFSTYAMHRIRGHILDALRSLDMLSRPARRRMRQIEAALGDMQHRLGRTPEDSELAAHLGLDVDTVRRTMGEAGRILLSLDSSETDDENDLHETLADDSESPLDQLTADAAREELVEAIAGLTQREQQVLSLYYRDELTMKEIGAVLDISESRVCQLHAKAVLSLRAKLKAETQNANTGALA